jgi:hypothetical protein
MPRDRTRSLEEAKEALREADKWRDTAIAHIVKLEALNRRLVEELAAYRAKMVAVPLRPCA